MELEVGMYVRTINGKIWIITSQKAISGHRKDIIKASHNIIDLIEPGDLMYIDISPDDCGGIVVPRVAETLNELKKWKKRFDSGKCILKGIVTREQLESMSYKVKEK